MECRNIVAINRPISIRSLFYTILQILSITIFERMPLNQIVTETGCKMETCDMANQLNLFDKTLGH